jgi:hypothetical protein
MLFTYEDILRAAMNLFPQINWKLTFWEEWMMMPFFYSQLAHIFEKMPK